MHQLPQKSTMRRSSLYLTAILRVPAFCSSQLEQQIDQSILPKGRKAQPGPTSYSHSLLLLPFPSRLRFAHPTAQRDPDAAVLKRISLKYIISQLPNAQSQPESHHYAHACDNNFLHNRTPAKAVEQFPSRHSLVLVEADCTCTPGCSS